MRMVFALVLMVGVVAQLKKNDYKFSTLCLEIVRSEPFRMRRGSQDLALQPTE